MLRTQIIIIALASAAVVSAIIYAIIKMNGTTVINGSSSQGNCLNNGQGFSSQKEADA